MWKRRSLWGDSVRCPFRIGPMSSMRNRLRANFETSCACLVKEVLLNVPSIRPQNLFPIMLQLERIQFLGPRGPEGAQNPPDPDIDGNGLKPAIGEQKNAVGDLPSDTGKGTKGLTGLLSAHAAKCLRIKCSLRDQSCRSKKTLGPKPKGTPPEICFCRGCQDVRFRKSRHRGIL